MTEDELVARADANYFDAFRILVTATDGGEARERDGLLITATGAPVAAFNIAFVTRPLSNHEALIQEAIAYFDSRSLPFVIRVREGVDQDSERAAESHGLPYSDTVPGMVLWPLAGTKNGPPPLEIRTVQDHETLNQYNEVFAAGFSMPLALAQHLGSRRLLNLPDCRLYIGYVGGQPVATSALVMTGRVAGVWNVATLEAFRRRGLGEAMTWHAAREGTAAGCLLANLQASRMGYPVYERMGFRLVAGYKTFVRPEFRS